MTIGPVRDNGLKLTLRLWWTATGRIEGMFEVESEE